MKINFTVLCLSVITVFAVLKDAGGVGIVLWIAYGFYKIDQNDKN